MLQIRETPQARRHLRHTILIHGYQNSEDRATDSYRLFEEHVKRSSGGLASLGTLWHFHWPGNHRSKITSVRTYAARIGVAELSALLLVRDFLAHLTRRQQVSLVAHSLGCRVALAAVADINRQGSSWRGARIRHVALLAAAVPQQLCLPPYKFRTRTPGSTEHAYFSRKDRALGWAFDTGQREFGEFGDAVGKTGRPWGRWSEDVDMNIGHSEYWPSAAVATYVAEAVDQIGTSRRTRTRGPAESEIPPLPPPERKATTRKSPVRPNP